MSDYDFPYLSPLHKAAVQGDIDKVSQLISEHHYVNDKTDEYNKYKTPLHLAAEKGHLEIVKALIAAGAFVDSKDSSGYTPLYNAINNEHREIAEFLVAAGADITLYGGWSPLHWAAMWNDIESARNLIAEGKYINEYGNDRMTPLHWAAERGNTEIARMLINAGADVSAESHGPYGTPLKSASNNGYVDIVRMLVKTGCELNDESNKDTDKETPLFLAAKSGHVDIVRILIAAGADVNTMKSPKEDIFCSDAAHYVDKNKGHALAAAVYENQKEIADLLIEAGSSLMLSGGWTDLHWAAMWGDKSKAESIIAQGIDVNILDGNGESPLHWAIRNRHTDIMDLLINAKADVNITGITSRLIHVVVYDDGISRPVFETSSAPILLAVKNNNIDAVERLISAGANQGRTNDKTPLQFAIEMNHKEIVKILIAAGADIEACWGRSESSLLLVAVEKGFAEIVEILLNAGMDPSFSPVVDMTEYPHEYSYYEGWSSLHRAVYNGHARIAKMLIASGANVNAKPRRKIRENITDTTETNDNAGLILLDDLGVQSSSQTADAENDTFEIIHEGKTPLHYVSRKDIFEALIAAGADIEGMDDNTPLHTAAYEGKKEIVKLLIEAGANVNAGIEQERKITPLYLTECDNFDRDIVKMLIAARADTTIRGRSPLHWSVLIGDLEEVISLISEGSDPNVKDEDNKTPISLAAQEGYIEIANVLIDAGAEIDSSTIYYAVYNGHKKIVELLINAKVNVDCKDCPKYNPLYAAAEKNRNDIVDALITAGADVNFRYYGGETPLHAAALNGNIGIVKSLIKAGAEINIQSKYYKKTPLHMAASRYNDEVFELLLAAGADPTIKDQYGNAPRILRVRDMTIQDLCPPENRIG